MFLFCNLNVKLKLNIVFTYALLFSLTSSMSFAKDINDAEDQAVMNEEDVVDYWRNSKIRPSTINKSSSIRWLSFVADDDKKNRRAAQLSNDYMKKAPGVIGLLLIDKEKIIFEGYKGLGSEKTLFYSQSIAKSLTSLAVGKAICSGAIKNLDQKSIEFVPEFENSNLGRSSIRQLLTMSSGTYLTKFVGWPAYVNDGIGLRPDGLLRLTGEQGVKNGELTLDEILWGRGIYNLKNKDFASPGKYFTYKAYDVLAFSKIIERATGKNLAAYFENEIWTKIGAENIALWTKDKNGSTLNNAGFAARLRDWGRLGIWILEQRKNDDCFGEYVRRSTTSQIKNMHVPGSVNSGPMWRGYGFYWWTDGKHLQGFCGKGYAGQHFCMNPKTDKIMIKFSSEENDGISDIFKTWNE